MYILLKCSCSFDTLLECFWFNKNNVTIASAKNTMYIHSEKTCIHLHSKEEELSPTVTVPKISAVAMQKHIQASKKDKSICIFAASMADIHKVLAPKAHLSLEQIRDLLPPNYHHQLLVFDPNQAAKLLPHCLWVDYHIELIKEDEKNLQIPWGPLYNMFRNELPVLHKELTSLLDKGFIRVSSSPAAVPVLFAKKTGGGLCMCIDYRALNAITKKSRYLLSLIHETLINICKAKWYTKLDVIAAFHKICIQEGDEWLTAFCTHFGLYKWLVTPFGTVGSPSTF
jgi:hypothetical protein